MNLLNKIKIEKTLWFLGLVVAFWVGKIYSNLNKFPDTLQPKILSDYIYSPKLNKGIYLKKKVWGMTSDKQIVFITKDKNSIGPNYKNDIVFENDNDIFYRVDNDSLIIYSRISKDVSNFKSVFKVKVVALENLEFMNLYNEFHESLKTSNWMK